MKYLVYLTCIIAAIFCIVIDRLDGSAIILGILAIDYLRKISEYFEKR